MPLHTQINDRYSSDGQLAKLVSSIDETFSNSGELIFSNRRNTIKSFQTDSIGKIVVKRFNAPNLIQRIANIARKSSKAQRAYFNGLALEKAGISAPLSLAYAEEVNYGTIGYSYYFSTFTPDHAIEELFSLPTDMRLVDAYARLICKMHSNGIVHHDMNRFNVLYHKNDNGDYELSVIDINRLTVSSKPLEYKEYIQDIVKLTDRIDFVVPMAASYARLRGMDEYKFVYDATFSKMWNNWRWNLKKWRFGLCIKMLLRH